MSFAQGSEAFPHGVKMDVLLPNFEIKLVCIDINSLVREETDRILKENQLPRDQVYKTFLREPMGKVTKLDQDKPFVDYLPQLAQGGTSLEITK